MIRLMGKCTSKGTRCGSRAHSEPAGVRSPTFAATHNTHVLHISLPSGLRSPHQFLPRAYANGNRDLEARERVHSAATIAGMAFANAFLVRIGLLEGNPLGPRA